MRSSHFKPVSLCQTTLFYYYNYYFIIIRQDSVSPFLNFPLGQWSPCQFPLLLLLPPGSSFPPCLICSPSLIFCSPLSAVSCLSLFCRTAGAKYNRLWYAALALVTLMLFTVAVGVLVFMGVYYTDPQACFYNKIFLGLNGSLCLIVSLLAISPWIQKRKRLRFQLGYKSV